MPRKAPLGAAGSASTGKRRAAVPATTAFAGTATGAKALRQGDGSVVLEGGSEATLAPIRVAPAAVAAAAAPAAAPPAPVGRAKRARDEDVPLPRASLNFGGMEDGDGSTRVGAARGGATVARPMTGLPALMQPPAAAASAAGSRRRTFRFSRSETEALARGHAHTASFNFEATLAPSGAAPPPSLHAFFDHQQQTQGSRGGGVSGAPRGDEDDVPRGGVGAGGGGEGECESAAVAWLGVDSSAPPRKQGWGGGGSSGYNFGGGEHERGYEGGADPRARRR